MNAIVEQLLAGEQRPTGQADLMLEAAGWAASAFALFDRAKVDAIVHAAAEAGHAVAGKLAEAAVKETGFGVAAHKKIKNEITSKGLYDIYRNEDFCSKRVIPEREIVELPRPAGVVFALTPSTNPVCTVFFKIMLALMTRNAIVISPHPMAKTCSAEAARVMAALDAGAADEVGHLGVGHPQYAFGGGLDAHRQRTGDPLQRPLRSLPVELQRAGQPVEIAQHHGRIGHRRQGPAATVAGRPGSRSGALRPDLQRP